MTLDDVYDLFDRIALVDDRIVRPNPADAAGQAEMWAVILHDVPLPFAAHAVVHHYQRSPYPLRPADIAEQWRQHIRDRLERHTESEPPIGDTGDGTYRAALLAERQAVARGDLEPRPVPPLRALAAGMDSAPGRGRAIVAAIGGVPEPRDGNANPRAIRCPRCGADPGRSCTTAGRRRADVHPARREAAHRAASGLPPVSDEEVQAEIQRRLDASRAALAALPPGTVTKPSDT
ncbi:zinc finger domain-containing protein [Streptomyces sp. XH2]|uniref:zinc finger domain-containing protein n=1 Tax=Streptomyces sp. XH2 TaxID=3412483 RepID=UPI003C7BC472